jgi:CheY-like chemotaxis protein
MQFFLNLLVNAIHALKNVDGPEISITLERQVRQIGTSPVAIPSACLRFVDNGCGIPEAEQRKIFDPFFTTKEVGEGSGLGLSMVYGIVTSMGGSIDVESRVGQGTCFHICFPAADRDAIVTATRNNLPILLGENERILLVEDNERLRNALADILTSLEYQVATAENGNQAMAELLAKDYYDLLITDAIMPETGGIELIISLRKQGYDIPAILITANAELAVTEAETYNFLLMRKPFEVVELSHKINALLRT